MRFVEMTGKTDVSARDEFINFISSNIDHDFDSDKIKVF